MSVSRVGGGVPAHDDEDESSGSEHGHPIQTSIDLDNLKIDEVLMDHAESPRMTKDIRDLVSAKANYKRMIGSQPPRVAPK